MMEEKIAKFIQFTLLPGWGVVSQNRLLRMCGSIESCYEKDLTDLLQLDEKRKGGRIGEAKLRTFAENRCDDIFQEEAERIVTDCRKKNIQIITADDEEYPKCLKDLPDMPVVLYVAGALKINDFISSIGLVGARRCTQEDKQKAIEKVEAEVKNRTVIISGMAKGIDSYAHTAALMNNGYTIAVLGNGPDICYPKEHETLYEEIKNQGCILSEYRPGIAPHRYLFPQRNRLIAALSDELYVIGAGRRSGTDSTVESGERYGRVINRI